MENSALVDALSELGLNQSELARLLSVDARTVRRWVSGMVTISGPAEIALKSWLTLNRCGLPWRPDGNDILDQELIQIAFFRAKTIDMAGILESVRARGGPAAPWIVDLNKRSARLNSIVVTFYRLPDGSFSPQSYCRYGPVSPDLERDRSLIEDAYACIESAISDDRNRN